MIKRVVGLVAALVVIAAFSTNASVVSGKITIDSTNGAALAGAKVLIAPRFGQGTTDSIVTGADGKFAFDTVVTGFYGITVLKTGYTAKTANTQVTGNTPDTVNVFLVAITYGKVLGTITTDSLRGAALTGAKVVLSTRNGIGGGTAVDSMVTAADGKYSFATVATGNYSLAVSKTGFTAKSTNTAVVGTATDTLNVFLATIVYGKVLGTVTIDSLRGTALTGAKVLLTTRAGIGGGTPLDSMVTAADGKYSFATVAAGNYSVVVSKTGYTAKTANTTVVGTASDTLNVFLAAIVYGKVIGTITADSATGPVVSGAKVVLSGGGAATDSMVTAADGKYSFATVTDGVHTVAVSKTGSTTRTVNATVTGTATDTVNVALATIRHGNILVFVAKQSDSSAVVGASITVGSNGGTLLSGTSGANGWATFSTLTTGNYTVSVTIANYTGRSVNTTVAANANDTVKVYLAASANPTKILKGVVTDTVGGAALANAQVTVRIAGTGIGGAITIIDSTDVTGAYRITGIPSTAATVSVTATKTNYVAYTAAAVATANDSTTYNFKMRTVPVSVVEGLGRAASMTPAVAFEKGGLIVSGVTGSAMLSIVALNGQVVYHGIVSSATRSIVVSSASLVKGGMLIAIVKQNGMTYRNTVVVK